VFSAGFVMFRAVFETVFFEFVWFGTAFDTVGAAFLSIGSAFVVILRALATDLAAAVTAFIVFAAICRPAASSRRETLSRAPTPGP
jgi:hypothetical protein